MVVYIRYLHSHIAHMLDVLLTYFSRNFTLTQEDIALIGSVCLPKKIRKGDYLQREGEVARYGAFVAKGMLRSYIIDTKGKEHIIQFAPENWWISDRTGMNTEAKSSFFIDAIEDSDLLLVDMAGHRLMQENIPGYAAMFSAAMQKRGAVKDKRIINSLTASAEERYNDFLESYASIAQRVPQQMLASYLGITPETLSRIRKSQSRRK